MVSVLNRIKAAAILVAVLAMAAPALAQVNRTLSPEEIAVLKKILSDAEKTQPDSNPDKSDKAVDKAVPAQVPENKEQATPTQTPIPSIAPGMLPAAPAVTSTSLQERWWVGTSYLAGFIRPDHLPPLVTTSPPGTKQLEAGVLGIPGTTTLFGNQYAGGELRSGVKIDGGAWFDQDRTIGFDTAFSILFNQTLPFSASSDGSTILARPFFNASSNQNASLLVAFPVGSGPSGVKSAGSINVDAASGPFYDFHFDLRENVLRDSWFSLNSLLGYRFLRFDDSLRVNQTMNTTGTVLAHITSQDDFGARNVFNGGEIGFEAEFMRGRWTLGFLTKVAVGGINRDININGGTQVTAGGTTTSTPGGLLALSTNSGNHQANDWDVVPEIGLNLSWNITNNLRFSVGYSLLYWFDVARAADQIDTTVNSKLINPSQIVTPITSASSRPAYSLQTSNLWMQSINLGFELRY